jgi:hypothetical protein
VVRNRLVFDVAVQVTNLVAHRNNNIINKKKKTRKQNNFEPQFTARLRACDWCVR